MQFGYFDEENKEYVIDRPDTPAPWANYLGSPEYGAIISNNAGGYSFVKSGAHGRIIRYIFNSFDQPGRYIYLRDNASKDYWSASWQPVGKPLDTYKSECRHGTGYTNIKALYSDIETEVLYYVPIDKVHEVWNLRITNKSNVVRNISAIGYCEFTNDSNYEQDQVNLQYTLFTTKTYFENNRIKQVINENFKKRYPDEPNEPRYFGLAGAKVDSYCGDKETFLGRYHNYSNPVCVENGDLGNVLNYNLNGCGALETKIVLQPGETKEIAFVLASADDDLYNDILSSYENVKKQTEKELAEIKEYWHSKLDNFQVKTPSKEFNSMINTWNAYQCFMTFIWSRAASFSYCGLRNGYGYRDTVQDIQGIIHLAPDMALEKIRFMLSAQVDNGGGLPLVKFTHNAGHEDTPDDEAYVRETGHPAYRADDALWLFPTVYKYIAETGNVLFLDEVIPFANKDAGTVYEHLKRAIDFSMNRLGNHNMPAGLHADWNDCLRLGKKGESTFVAMQLYYAMTVLKEFATKKKDFDYIEYLNNVQTELGNTINELCWDEDRFIRGFKEDGCVIGAKKDPEANMWLNPQSWSVISGIASEKQANMALDCVYNELNTPYGTMLMAPAYEEHAFDGALMLLFNPSTKENGGIFSQTQGWLILAEALMGHGNRAFLYFEESSPACMNDKAEIRKLEPYCHGQFTEGSDSTYAGRSHVHWLTGTASTVMVGCVEGILGMRPDENGLKISPSIPSKWDSLEINKTFRNKRLHIVVNNESGAECGYKKVVLNGETLKDNYIPETMLKETNEIEYIM